MQFSPSWLKYVRHTLFTHFTILSITTYSNKSTSDKYHMINKAIIWWRNLQCEGNSNLNIKTGSQLPELVSTMEIDQAARDVHLFPGFIHYLSIFWKLEGHKKIQPPCHKHKHPRTHTAIKYDNKLSASNLPKHILISIQAVISANSIRSTGMYISDPMEEQSLSK